MSAPFCDATRAELVARVAFQLVVLEYRRNKAAYERPGLLIATVQATPFVQQSLDFRLALSSMYLVCGTEGRTSRQWLNNAILRARSGLLFRAVFHPDYKANRRDPRVTNRGVKPRTPLNAEANAYDTTSERGGLYNGD